MCSKGGFQKRGLYGLMIEKWHIPYFESNMTLWKALDMMADIKLDPKQIPLIIQLVENPKYDVGLFAGNVDLFTHDSIHVILGRGLLTKDEAFVIGYTMGSTKKIGRWRKNLFMFCAKYLYPKGYRFGEEERFVFNMGVAAGNRCPTDLSTVDFHLIQRDEIRQIRQKFGINNHLIKACYELEKRMFGGSYESERLLRGYHEEELDN